MSSRLNLSSEAAEGVLTQELVGARLDELAELPRSVFLLRHLDGLEVAAIGARLGIGAEDVERHLADAMRVLELR
jgi:DNA-directed RNA polymerase specialized sigma24 family protein